MRAGHASIGAKTRMKRGPRTVRIKVNPDLCEGHNRCFALAPDLFEVDDYGLSRARHDGAIPLEREEQARLAIDNCPEFAISVIEGD